jgi:hypothetical protein
MKTWAVAAVCHLFMFNRNMIENVCFHQRVPLDFCFDNRNRYSIFNVKHCKERKNIKLVCL